MIYIVTPVFNRREYTRSYLSALKKQSIIDFKTIIVDDGSLDGTSEMIENEFPKVKLIKMPGNLWWAEATNIGVKYALNEGADYIITLNDDTIPSSEFIEKMIYWSEKYPEALLGAFAVDSKTGAPEFGGENLDWRSGKFIKNLDIIPSNKQYGLYEVNIFPGRGLLIPAEVFKKVGFYDSKHFPQTVADLDFTAGAYKAGYKIYCNFDARIAIYPEESGGVKLREQKSLKNYYQHLFGMRGAGNIKWFTIFAFKNAPRKYLLSFWVIGIFRRIGGYLLDWINEQ